MKKAHSCDYLACEMRLVQPSGLGSGGMGRPRIMYTCQRPCAKVKHEHT